MKANKYIVELVIDTQDTDPDTLTSIIGLTPTTVLKKGMPWVRPTDKKIIEGKVNEHNIWVYRTSKIYENEDRPLHDAISEFLNMIRNSSSILKECLKKYPENHLKCISYFYETNPGFQMNAELIRELNEYSLNVSFDFYMLGD